MEPHDYYDDRDVDPSPVERDEHDEPVYRRWDDDRCPSCRRTRAQGHRYGCFDEAN